MRRVVVGVMALALGGASASGAAGRESCPTVQGARASLDFPVAKNAYYRVKRGDPAREVLREARGWGSRCPTSEGAWYALLRARELLQCDPRQTVELAERAAKAVPASVWIATVRARLLGTVAAAERAVSLDPRHMPAQLALGWALLSDGQTSRAASVIGKVDSDVVPEARGVRARLYLIRSVIPKALREATAEGFVVLGGDMFLAEPRAGLQWPWVGVQVAALANAKLGQARKAAEMLPGIPTATLPELREEVRRHTKAAEQLMEAMARTVDNAREDDAVRDDMAVSLARLRVVSGQVDLAKALVSANAKRLERFCTGLAELFWIAGLDVAKGAAFDELQDMCRLDGRHGQPVTEPAECRGG